MSKRRVDVRAILADPELRRKLMVPALQATQAREGIETTREQAERAYYVVTEGDRAAFFDLQRYRDSKGQPDRRHEMFVRAFVADTEKVRFDVARRDFAAIEGSPLAYRSVGIISTLFRSWPSLKESCGVVQRGAPTGDDERLVRHHWEVMHAISREDRVWEPFSKGGSFSRFYYDVELRVAWDPKRRSFHRWYGRKGRQVERPESLDNFFLPSIAWPRRTQRGFSARLAENAVFSDKSGFVQPHEPIDRWFVLSVMNSTMFEYVLQALISFGSFEVGTVQKVPLAVSTKTHIKEIAALGRSLWESKAIWDEGNEVSTRFTTPWLLRPELAGTEPSLIKRLDRHREYEAETEDRLERVYSDLNNRIYRLYGISEGTRSTIEATLAARPPEVLWPQMEGATAEQKRMEHVFRLLSYAVLRVMESDPDGIVPFAPAAGDTSLSDRVHHQLQTFFPNLDFGKVEAEIANELKKSVKGYRRTDGISEWLANAFFDFHCRLYKSRPILWHVASSQGTSPFAFGVLVHYHRFDKNRMAQLRARYVRDAIETYRREAALADKAGKTEARLEWQSGLEEVQELDRRLQWVQEGHHEAPDGGERDYRIGTPWKAPKERPKGWDPDLDDGVKVNLEPLQKAGVLRLPKVV